MGKRHYYNYTGEDEIRFNKSVDAGVGLKSRGLYFLRHWIGASLVTQW